MARKPKHSGKAKRTKEVAVTIRFRSRQEVDAIKRAAEHDERSFNQYVVRALAELAEKQLAVIAAADGVEHAH